MATGGVIGFEGEFIHSHLCEFHSVSFVYVLVSVAEGVHSWYQLQGEFV